MIENLKMPVYRASPAGSCIFLMSFKKTEDGEVKPEINVLKILTEKDIRMATRTKKTSKRTKLETPVDGMEVATSLNLSLMHDDGGTAYSTAGSYVVLKVNKKFTYEEEIESALVGLGKIADELVRRRTEATAKAVKLTPVSHRRQDKDLSLDDML